MRINPGTALGLFAVLNLAVGVLWVTSPAARRCATSPARASEIRFFG